MKLSFAAAVVLYLRKCAGAADATPCYAMTGWLPSATCAKCASPQWDQCPSTSYTPCYETLEKCQKANHIQPGGQTTTPYPVTAPVNPVTTPPPNPVNPTTPPPNPVKPTTTTTEAPGGVCYAGTTWSSGKCAICPAPQGGACPSSTWTPCYSTEKECLDKTFGGGGGGSSFCNSTCPTNTLGMTRPSFLGPNCYDSQYGSNFGPKWVPSGKTRFEKLLPTPSDLHRLMQTVKDDDAPHLQQSWKIAGCPAATAVYENMVCALEIMEGKSFDKTSGGHSYSASDFLNSGDEKTDLLELASFFSHKMKETGRYGTWEEAAGTPYADPSNTQYPPVAGVEYHGRGPVQISWNYNYGPFSEWMFNDKNVLLSNPAKVDPEGPMGFIAAVWFWMTPRQFTSGAPIAGTFRTRDAIIGWLTPGKINSYYSDKVDYDSVAGLGLSINVINGGIECSPGDGSWGRWRVAYFLTVADKVNITVPNVDDASKCVGDRFCNGLYAGCTAVKATACKGTDGVCGGKDYVSGWTTNLCAAS